MGDVRGYELPTFYLFEGIVFENGPKSRTDFDVIIEFRGGPPQRINKLHQSYMSLQFPLLFVFGQPGFYLELQLKPRDGRGRGKAVTMNAYYKYQLHPRAKEFGLPFRSGRLVFEQKVKDFVKFPKEVKTSGYVSAAENQLCKSSMFSWKTCRELSFVKEIECAWYLNSKQWKRRKIRTKKSRGRLTYVHPSSGDLFYFRMLLCHQKGCRSPIEVRTINGQTLLTYRAACEDLGLLGDDKEWDITLQESDASATSSEIRVLFSQILIYYDVADPLKFRSSDVGDSLVHDRFANVEGMHAVPPPMTGNYMPSGPDREVDDSMFTYGPKQSKTSESHTQTSNYDSCESNSSTETLESMPEPVVVEPNVVSQPKVWPDAPIIEEYESDSDDEYVIQPSKEQERPSFAFIDTVKHVKTPRETVKEQSKYSPSSKANKRDWNGLMSKRLGLRYGFTKKACFVCGSFSHLIRDCDFHEKRMAKQVELNKKKGKGTGQGENRPVWNNVQKD
ncbi:hypothetical protein Tco_0795713 [Tanacetum coccineum]